MITLNKVKEGIKEYATTEFLNKLHDGRKWLVGAGIVLLDSQIDAYYSKSKNMLVTLGFVNEDDTFNLDKIYNTFREQAIKTGPIMHPIPILGEVKFSVEDIDKLYNLMR